MIIVSTILAVFFWSGDINGRTNAEEKVNAKYVEYVLKISKKEYNSFSSTQKAVYQMAMAKIKNKNISQKKLEEIFNATLKKENGKLSISSISGDLVTSKCDLIALNKKPIEGLAAVNYANLVTAAIKADGNIAKDLKSDNGIKDGSTVNAYRHANWNAQMTAWFHSKKTAAFFSDYHEGIAYATVAKGGKTTYVIITQENTKKYKTQYCAQMGTDLWKKLGVTKLNFQMDIYNNSIGRDYGSKYRIPGNIAAMSPKISNEIKSAVKAGKMKYIAKKGKYKGKLVWTNQR